MDVRSKFIPRPLQSRLCVECLKNYDPTRRPWFRSSSAPGSGGLEQFLLLGLELGFSQDALVDEFFQLEQIVVDVDR